MKANLLEAFQQLARGKHMTAEQVRDILETALLSAARKTLAVTPERVEAHCDPLTGDMRVTVKRLAVEGKPGHADEISLAEAKRTMASAVAGDEVVFDVPIGDMGRIAAQTAKHIVLQRVREVEREGQYGEFKAKVGQTVTSLVKQRRGKLVILDLGDVEAVLPGSEQIPKEDYRAGEHLKVYVAEVSMTPRGPHIIASRNRPELVKYLFEQEVPEVAQGIVEIKAVAREPGSRSKVAVFSHDRNVDPVGACIGMKGMRVQAVVQELHGEKMDVVAWAEDPEAFLIAALSPAKPSRVVKDDVAQSMVAVAADHNQLTHLIGRGGQNARLASKLTGWRVDIMTEAELRGEVAPAVPAEGAAPEGPAPEAFVIPGGEAPAMDAAPSTADAVAEAVVAAPVDVPAEPADPAPASSVAAGKESA